jgi:hypothetical protein
VREKTDSEGLGTALIYSSVGGMEAKAINYWLFASETLVGQDELTFSLHPSFQ